MKRKVYWKDLFGSFTHSKGRFLSILTLMLLGSLALVGLKVTTPNMHRTANQFIQQQKMLDLAVMGDLGLDQADQEELLGVKGARVEFGSLLDLTVKGTGKAIRLFSAPKSLSFFLSCDQGAPAQKRRGTGPSKFLGGSLSDRGYPHTCWFCSIL